VPIQSEESVRLGGFRILPLAGSAIIGRMFDVTRLLDAAATGARQAAADLLALVYDELRQLAAARMAVEAPGHTLDATALVHEAYLRLAGADGEQAWNGRGHFFASGAEAMRRILVESARRKTRRKHGGGWQRRELPSDIVAENDPAADLLAIDSALSQLAQLDLVKARLVELRFFAGMTGEQAAIAVGISLSTADRHRVFDRGWLRRELGVGRKK
jgi:RNA polymerase sigma factor (TIGR02999 family)